MSTAGRQVLHISATHAHYSKSAIGRHMLMLKQERVCSSCYLVGLGDIHVQFFTIY